MTKLYNIKQKSQTMADGVDTTTYTVYETRNIEVQPLQMLKWGDFGRLEVEIGGQKYNPTYRGFLSEESEITAADYITMDSGTSNYLVLRAFKYEDHIELDLRDIGAL